MATLADRILDAIRYSPLDDDILAARLGVSSRQAVNQTARRLEREGLLRRRTGPGGKIVNEWLEAGAAAVAMGSNLVPADGSLDGMYERTRRAVASCRR